jgi:ribokinase
VLGLTDICVPNEHEAQLLGGPHALRNAGAGTVVMTQGARGAVLVTASGSITLPAFAVEPVDTTAAGDAFCGTLAARLALGADLMTALRWGAAAGALATTRVGAVPSLPLADEIAAVVARG